MDSKEASYQPLISPESFTDDECDSRIDAAILRDRSWRRLVPSPLLGAVMLLIALTSTLIVLVLTWKPTDMQCTKQLSMYCEFSTKN